MKVSIVSPTILSKIDDPINSKNVLFTNGWRSENSIADGKDYMILEAGVLKSNLEQGVVIVKTMSDDGSITVNEKIILTPNKYGIVKAENGNGNNIFIVAKNGYKWIFNVFDGFRIIPQ